MFGNVFIGVYDKHIHILRAKKDGSGSEIIEEQRILQLNDFKPKSSFKGGFKDFNFSRLSNGNILYVGLLDEIVGFTHTQERLTSVEIDSRTLDVIDSKLIPITGLKDFGVLETFHMINDLFVFKGELKMPVDFIDSSGNSSWTLVLASTDFAILDHCSQAEMSEDFEELFIAASSNRIVSAGVESRLYLHEVDFETKKLVLLKTVVLDGAEILRSGAVVQNSSDFCLFAKISEQEEAGSQEIMGVVLKFGKDLELVSHLKTEVIQEASSIYGLGDTKFAFCEEYWLRSRSLYVVEMEARELQLIHKLHSNSSFDDSDPSYVVDDNLGKEWIFMSRRFRRKLSRLFLTKEGF